MRIAGLVGIAAAVLAANASAGGAAQQAAAHTVQQDFDAASQLGAAKDFPAALAAWEALEARTRGNPRSHALVLVRKSAVLLELGRRDEAAAAARTGLAALPVNDPTLIPDRFVGWFNLGRIASASLDYATAAAAFRQAEQVTDDNSERLSAQLGEIGADTFVDPSAAKAALERSRALTARIQVSDPVKANLSLRAAVLALNTGDIAAARQESAAAVTQLGGMTERTDIADVQARNTAGLAALLAGDGADARRYFAFTGAGRLPTGRFDPAAEMKVPDCGGEANLKPEDVAVVEFSIDEDGTVLQATPIYANRGGGVALAFARIAREWSWTPEQIKDLPPFFRYAARVEMRCSTGFERPSIAALLDDRLVAWLRDKGVAVSDDEGGAAAALDGERRALGIAQAKDPTGLDTLAALRKLINNVVVARDEREQLAIRALQIARDRQAPIAAQLSLDLLLAESRRAETWRSRGSRDAASALLAEPVYAGDPTSRVALRLLIADAASDPGSRQVVLEQAADDGALAPTDPLRVGALVRLASLEQQKGDTDAARAAFVKTGLTADQCALVGAEPHMIHVGGTYPQEAMQWGFEGWVKTQYDIDADGKVVNERALLSYPPFVFTKAGLDTLAGARYTKTYRPDGGLGCDAVTQRVKFMFPH